MATKRICCELFQLQN